MSRHRRKRVRRRRVSARRLLNRLLSDETVDFFELVAQMQRRGFAVHLSLSPLTMKVQ